MQSKTNPVLAQRTDKPKQNNKFIKLILISTCFFTVSGIRAFIIIKKKKKTKIPIIDRESVTNKLMYNLQKMIKCLNDNRSHTKN